MALRLGRERRREALMALGLGKEDEALLLVA